LLAITAGLTPRPALASALSSPVLHWVRAQGAEACVAPRALSERVESMIGAPLARAADAEHTVEGRIAALGRGFRVQLRLTDRAGALLGERQLEQPGADCAQLTERIAFLVAMMIDPEATAHGLPPALLDLLDEDEPEEHLLRELESDPPRTNAVAAPELVAPVPRPTRPPPAVLLSSKFQLVLSGSAAIGAGPRAALLAQLQGLFRIAGPLSGGASLWGGGQPGRHALGDGHALRVGHAGGALLLCAGQASASPWRLTACLGPQLSLRYATGFGFEDNRQSLLVNAGAAGQLGVRLRIRRGWGMAALAAAQLGFSRPRLLAVTPDGGESTAYRFPRASFSIGIGPSFER
jgi:hypothetical protein